MRRSPSERKVHADPCCAAHIVHERRRRESNAQSLRRRHTVEATIAAPSGRCARRSCMIDYTLHVRRLIEDILARVPALGHIDAGQLLVFARVGRTHTHGPFATCHSLMLPDRSGS